MSDFLEGQDHLIQMLNDLGTAQVFDVYDGAVPTGKKLRQVAGRYLPYVVFGLGGKTEAANRMQGIASSKEDVRWSSFVLYCVADAPASVRKLKDLLRNVFEGYVIGPGWGELTEVLAGDFGISKPDPDLVPLRYGEPLVFKLLTDA